MIRVNMDSKKFKTTQEDYLSNLEKKFISDLEKKLHYTTQGHGSGAWINHISTIDQYTNEKMSEKEVGTLLDIVESSKYVLVPFNTSMGFAVGFKVIDPEKKEIVLKFVEKQLPSNYSFATLSCFFMNGKNLYLANQLGETDISRDRDSYTY